MDTTSPSVILLAVYAVINVFSFSMVLDDKKRSQKDDRRISEGKLLFAAIAGGAQLFVREITVLSPLVGITPLVLSLIIAPLATELPEKFNSVLWVRQRKDTLAMGNISGAMVFQSCIPVAVGLWYTPWVLDQAAIASAAIAVGAGLLLQVLLRPGNVLSGGQLAFFGLFYAAFIVYIVGFYQGPIPVPH